MDKEYKDSGIPWIGEVPKGWETMRFKNFVSLKTATSSSDNKIGLENIESESGRFVETESKFEDNGVGFEKGDIVYGKLRPYLRKVWLATFRGNAVGDFYVFSPKSNSDCQYVKWLLLSDGFTKEVIGSTYGAKMPRVASEFILTLPYALPPLLEQQRIAKFLDRKCGEIDELIALQEEFIKELKAYKQSVITEAVTRGLNPNVKFKDSGIDWIGKIPQGWKCEKVKHIISSIASGVSVNAEQIPATDEELGVLKTSSVSSNYFIPTENKKVDVEEMGRVSCPVKADTIIVSRMNTPDLVGSAGYCDDNIPNLYLPDRLWQVETIKDRVSARYLWRFLISLSARYYYSSLSQGTSSSMQNISQSQFESAYVPVPPLTEQQQIADYLDNKCSEIDSLIAIKQQKIEELKDYKKSVIYEYVTGKKEVE